jgi:hypothetical protein
MAERNYTEQLKILKEKNPPSKELLNEVKEQSRIKSAILKSVSENAKSVPEISLETGVPSHIVLWYLAGLKKYGMIFEEGKKGTYYSYKKKVN